MNYITNPFVQKYINEVSEKDIISAFENQRPILENILNKINDANADFAYDSGKWTLKELWQHIIDTERVFAYRALSIARGEKQNLPGFDENDFAKMSNANARQWSSIMEEMLVNRTSIEILFSSFNENVLLYSGKANGNDFSVMSLGLGIVGHAYHHIRVIEERYFPAI